MPDAEGQSIRQLGIMVQRHEKDLYQGHGKNDPSLTARMSSVEEAVKDIIEMRKEAAKKQNQIQMLVWAALITGIANLLFSHLKF